MIRSFGLASVFRDALLGHDVRVRVGEGRPTDGGNVRQPGRERNPIVRPLLVVAVLAMAAASSCSPAAAPVKAESIVLGTVLLEPSLPVFVAEDQGLFAKNGLKVATRYYDVGLHAAEGVARGDVDLATPVAEYVLVGQVLKKQGIQAIASVDEVDYAWVIGRKDRGINAISDLKGKRIGVVRGTILDFQLGRFLDLNHVDVAGTTFVNGSLPESADSLVRGDLDAVMTIPPFIGTVQAGLGGNAIAWPAQNKQPFFSLVLAKSDWIGQHREAVERFLRAMDEAERFIAEHPDQAKAILKRKLKFTDADAERVWADNDYSLSLDQALILAMEDEARWMIKGKLTSETVVPDFPGSVYTEGLENVKPEAVNITR